MNGLRLYGGIEVSLFSERTGLEFESIERGIEKSIADGLLDKAALENGMLKTSEKGQLFLNELLERFL